MKLLIGFNKHRTQREDTILTNSSPLPEYTTAFSILQWTDYFWKATMFHKLVLAISV